MRGGGAGPSRLGLALALALASLTLRPQLVGLGPLIPEMQEDLGVSHAVAGLLGTIPVLCMGLFAPPAAFLASWGGPRRAVSLAVGLIAVFGVLRAIAPQAWLVIALTFPIGVGMGLGNALMVVAVKERFADRPLIVTAIYAAGIQIGAAVSAAVAVPIADAAGGWRWSLGLFGIAALVCLGLWLALSRGSGGRPARRERPPKLPWRSGIAWLLATVYFLTTIVYYGLGAWLPDAYVEQGWDEARAGYLIAVLNVAALVATLLLAFVGGRLGGSRRTYMWGAAAAMITGTALLASAPAGGWAWAALTGAAIGTIFPVMLTLPLDVADDPADVGAVAGVMLGAGYALAAAAPLVLGAVRDVTGSFSVSLWAIVFVAVLLVPAVAPFSPARLRRGVRQHALDA